MGRGEEQRLPHARTAAIRNTHDELYSESLPQALLRLHKVFWEASPPSPTVGRMWAGGSTDPDPNLSSDHLVAVLSSFQDLVPQFSKMRIKISTQRVDA